MRDWTKLRVIQRMTPFVDIDEQCVLSDVMVVTSI